MWNGDKNQYHDRQKTTINNYMQLTTSTAEGNFLLAPDRKFFLKAPERPTRR